MIVAGTSERVRKMGPLFYREKQAWLLHQSCSHCKVLKKETSLQSPDRSEAQIPLAAGAKPTRAGLQHGALLEDPQSIG